jgi:hypothetical protein
VWSSAAGVSWYTRLMCRVAARVVALGLLFVLVTAPIAGAACEARCAEHLGRTARADASAPVNRPTAAAEHHHPDAHGTRDVGHETSSGVAAVTTGAELAPALADCGDMAVSAARLSVLDASAPTMTPAAVSSRSMPGRPDAASHCRPDAAPPPSAPVSRSFSVLRI